MSNFMLISLPPAVGIGAIPAPACLFRARLARLNLNRTTASLFTAGFRGQHAAEDMLLRKAEVQYVLPKCRSTIAR
ncbi:MULTISPECIES: hypothetical protein [unclassified Bradyrhizobium]|uniref:hypothetical protein n=1 Tax=unclassified Bradyrhizobium TaxID=2631580 RepID=UPI002479E85B|nr:MULTISPECIES: hypothetical protein [unclassified Bradyrhizobium]WGR75363.1 hypothetical protein MTX24_06225 [Bradyrhizobium sp. ISRA426]WGR82990.1 hypothetical protein MTX21_31175 [Bradyrhizobium sp. ISRA430]WGR90567.1 hypothetical protein MTX25_06225 [Bradyrhizobium sp. ISRA432]